MKITINNSTKISPNDIYVMLTGANFAGTGITIDKSHALSSLTNNGFDLNGITNGRIYVSYYTPLPVNPVPTSNDYYGYIEPTLGADNVLWVDISSVDVFGVPLGISVGSDNLGFSKSHNAILKEITSVPGMNGKAIQRDNGKGNIKLVGANVAYADQPSYANYINDLKGSALRIKSLDDSPLKYDFSGTFENDGSVSLKSTLTSDTFSISVSELNSNSIYLCNGSCTYNGKSRNAMSPNDTCAAVYRDIMVGFNEGYFTKGGTNNSYDFPNMTPFASGYGNAYAKYIHEGSDSYGYPFADKNLKTLIKMPVTATTELTLTVLGDDATS